MTKQQAHETKRRNTLISLCAAVATFLVGATTATAAPFIVGLIGTPFAALMLWGCEVNNE